MSPQSRPRAACLRDNSTAAGFDAGGDTYTNSTEVISEI